MGKPISTSELDEAGATPAASPWTQTASPWRQMPDALLYEAVLEDY
jgi:hypothetical protein